MAVGEAAEAAALPVAVPVSVPPQADGAATRYLCAAAHLRAPMLPASPLHQIAAGRVRRASLLGLAPGPAKPPAVGRAYARLVLGSRPLMALVPGVDAERVAWHCRIARRQLWLRDIVLGLLVSITGLVLIVAVAVAAFRYAPRRARREIVPLAVALVLVCVAVGRLGLMALLIPPVGVAACWAVFFADNLLARQRLRRLASAEKDPRRLRDSGLFARWPLHAPVLRIDERRTVADEGENDVIPYARNRIVGAGVSDGTRTITIAVDKPAKDAETQHFKAHELLEHIAEHARGQSLRHEPTHGIPQLDVALVLAVPELLWKEHDKKASRATIYGCADHPQSGAAKRALVRVQAVAWDGQLVVSLYVSVALEGRYLSVTVLPHVLPPLLADLRIADGLQARHALVHASHAATDAVREMLQLSERLRKAADRGTKEDRQKHARKEHKRPTLSSPREAYAAAEPDDIIQRDDALRIIITVQTRVFDVTEQFLVDHGIDTEEFTAQVQVIMQNSVIVEGNVTGNVQNVHGDGAQATNKAPPQKGTSP